MADLDLSGNSLHDQETCRKLGLFLGKATALRILNVANTQTQWQFVCVAFEKSQSIIKVNVSDLKVTVRMLHTIFFLNLFIPTLCSI